MGIEASLKSAAENHTALALAESKCKELESLAEAFLKKRDLWSAGFFMTWSVTEGKVSGICRNEGYQDGEAWLSHIEPVCETIQGPTTAQFELKVLEAFPVRLRILIDVRLPQDIRDRLRAERKIVTQESSSFDSINCEVT